MTRDVQVPGESTPEPAAEPAPVPDTPKRSDTPPPDFALHADTDWKTRTWQEAMAASIKKAVLCRDGWYVPADAASPRLPPPNQRR